MNTKSTIMLLALCSAIPVLQIASASSDTLESRLRQCRTETDSLKRLNCYDALPLPVADGRAPIASTASAPAPAATTGKDRFGLAAAPAPQVQQSIESQIDGRFLGWRPGAQLKLRNGQVWEIADDSSAAYEIHQPTVRIERGRFGGFFMRIDGVAQMPRVRRVQ